MSKRMRTRRKLKDFEILSKVLLVISRSFWAICKKVTLHCRFWSQT